MTFEINGKKVDCAYVWFENKQQHCFSVKAFVAAINVKTEFEHLSLIPKSMKTLKNHKCPNDQLYIR